MKFDMSIYWKSLEKIQVPLKSDKNNGYFTMKSNVHLQYAAELFSEWEMSQTEVVEKIKTYIIFNDFVRK